MASKRKSTTFIELITTVVVVALIAGTLTPALAKFRRHGKDAVCLQNLARIAQASVVYAVQDPDENAIPVHRLALQAVDQDDLYGPMHAWGGKSGRGISNGGPFWGTDNGFGPATRPLNQILYGDLFPDYSGAGPLPAPPPGGHPDTALDLDVYRCPADRGATGRHYPDFESSDLTSYDFFGNSYWANVLWVGTMPGRPLYSLSPFLQPLSRVPNPTETVWYSENVGRFAWFAEPQVSPFDCGIGDATIWLDGWHGRPWTFNTAFVDAHVAPVHMRGREAPDIGRYPEGGRTFWSCVIIRGPGWQIDTLPAPAVETEVLWPGSPAASDVESEPDARLVPVDTLVLTRSLSISR